MSEKKASAVTFERSSALFDNDGGLREWDAGFVAEFRTASHLLNAGTAFQDILRYVYENDPDARTKLAGNHGPEEMQRRIEKRLQRFGEDISFEYRNADQVILVQEVATPSGCVCRVARDVTADRQYRDALQSARKQHQVMQVPTWLRRELDGRMVYPPPSEDTRQVMGLPDDFDVTHPMAAYSRIEQTPEELARYAAAFEDSMRNMSVLTTEFRTHTTEGTLKWIRTTMAPVREPDGAFLWTGMMYDITREKAAEGQADLLRSAAMHSTDAIVIFENQRDAAAPSTILYFNPAFERLTGFVADEVAEKATTIFSGNPEDQASRQIAQALEGNGTGVIELEIYRQDGSKLWVEGRPTIVNRFEDGAYRWVMVLRDIAERRRVQGELMQAKEAAEAASRVKSEFLANMSHEIRTPMNGVLGMNGLLLGTSLDEEQRKYALAVEECAESLLTILNDILDISKLDAGKVELETIRFDLTEAVERTLTILSGKAQEKGIELGAYIDPNARVAIEGDPHRLRQILLNLIGNGIKFTEKGGVSVEVSRLPSADPEIATVRFAVKDTGVGIPEDIRLKLFQKFSQADSSVTRRYGGTGLGLAICRQLVELMGGIIDVASQRGVGSEFYFEVPFRISSEAPAELPVVPMQIRDLRALAVDDIEMNLDIIKRQLQELGMTVTCCQDGFDALAQIERSWHRGKPYDVVFLDQMMPSLSGDMVAKRIRSMPHLGEVKIILVSSAGAQHLVGGLFDAALDKPLRQRDLAGCLAELYNRAGAPVPADGAMRAKSAGSPGQIATAARSLRILLAEDNKINRIFALALLSKAGHRIDLAENGHEAVDAVRRDTYDVVLMDVQMPELDGVQATRQIRALPPPKCDVKIIALTADAMSGSREQYISAGMDDYITKPIDSNLLLRKLDALIGGCREHL